MYQGVRKPLLLELDPPGELRCLAGMPLAVHHGLWSHHRNDGVLLIGAAGMLMTFPGARQFGASLLASAGLAGLAVGFAARPVLGNLIAGMQIAITQPIRLDDVVIVENEWGRIEEITGTYVIVRIWDDRRLVVPLQYFIEKPFQNWTRRNSSIIGSVFFWVDYSLPLEPLREELRRLCQEVPELWDTEGCGSGIRTESGLEGQSGLARNYQSVAL